MPSKYKYQYTSQEYPKVKRNSNHDYTHAVVIIRNDGKHYYTEGFRNSLKAAKALCSLRTKESTLDVFKYIIIPVIKTLKKWGKKIVHILNGIAIVLFIVYMVVIYKILKKTKPGKKE